MHDTGGTTTDQVSNFAEKIRQIFGRYEYRAAKFRAGILISGKDGSGRLVRHKASVSTHVEASAGRLHLQVAEHQIVLQCVEFTDGLGGGSGGIDVVAAGFKDRL